MKYLDFILNGTLPFLNGYKTIAAGSLAAVGCATGVIASIANPHTAQILTTVSQYANQAAGYLGIVGVCGKVAKREK